MVDVHVNPGHDRDDALSDDGASSNGSYDWDAEERRNLNNLENLIAAQSQSNGGQHEGTQQHHVAVAGDTKMSIRNDTLARLGLRPSMMGAVSPPSSVGASMATSSFMGGAGSSSCTAAWAGGPADGAASVTTEGDPMLTLAEGPGRGSHASPQSTRLKSTAQLQQQRSRSLSNTRQDIADGDEQSVEEATCTTGMTGKGVANGKSSVATKMERDPSFSDGSYLENCLARLPVPQSRVVSRENSRPLPADEMQLKLRDALLAEAKVDGNLPLSLDELAQMQGVFVSPTSGTVKRISDGLFSNDNIRAPQVTPSQEPAGGGETAGADDGSDAGLALGMNPARISAATATSQESSPKMLGSCSPGRCQPRLSTTIKRQGVVETNGRGEVGPRMQAPDHATRIRLERLLSGAAASDVLGDADSAVLTEVADDCLRALETLRYVTKRQQELIRRQSKS